MWLAVIISIELIVLIRQWLQMSCRVALPPMTTRRASPLFLHVVLVHLLHIRSERRLHSHGLE